jgi:hypothetical protein
MASSQVFSTRSYPSTRGELLLSSTFAGAELELTAFSHRRYHAVQEFNRGVFDYLIATDESGLEGHDRDTVDEDKKEEQAGPTRELPCRSPLDASS